MSTEPLTATDAAAEQSILTALAVPGGPWSAGLLGLRTGLPRQQVAAVLSTLEMRRAVRRLPGDRYEAVPAPAAS